MVALLLGVVVLTESKRIFHWNAMTFHTKHFVYVDGKIFSGVPKKKCDNKSNEGAGRMLIVIPECME